MFKRSATAAALLCLLSTSTQGFAAAPEKVGNYTGLMVVKIHNLATGARTVQRHNLLLQVNADDTYTLTNATTSGVLSGTGAFGVKHGFLWGDDGSLVQTHTLHWTPNNKVIRGGMQAGNKTSTGLMIEGRMVLRKL